MDRSFVLFSLVGALLTVQCGGLVNEQDGGPSDAGVNPDVVETVDATDITDAADGSDAADAADSSDIVLTSNAGLAQSIAVDSTYIYWSTQAGNVLSCTKQSNCAEPFATIAYNQSDANNLTLDGGFLYWDTSDGTIARCAVNNQCGNAPTAMQTIDYGISSLAIHAGNLYWNRPHEIDGCAIADCFGTAHAIVSGAIQPTSVVADDVNIYWGDLGSGADNGQKLYACTLSGCTTPTLLADGVNGVAPLIQSVQTLFWRENVGSTGVLRSCDKAGCTPSTVGASDQITGGALFLDGDNAYWTTVSGIVRCNALSCLNGATLIAVGQQSNQPSAFAADTTTLYWSDLNGTIHELTPK